MFDKILQVAEQLWDKLAGQKSATQPVKKTTQQVHAAGSTGKSSGEAAPTTSSVSSHGYTSFEIFPYKDNEYGVSHWAGFLHNFSSITDEFFFQLVGDASAVRMYMHVPNEYAQYVENVFYASFPTTDLKQQTWQQIKPSKHASWFKFSDECVFYDTTEFLKWGSYVDPFKDIISLFGSMPVNTQLTLTFAARFDKKLSRWKAFFKWFTEMFSKPSQPKTTEEIKDKKEEEEIKKIGRDVFFGVACEVSGAPEGVTQRIHKDVLNVFDKVLQKGSIKPKKKKQIVAANVNQFVNLFHIPLKEHPSKLIQYTDYRKLSYPMNLPTRENSQKNDITLLGYTDYKTQNIKFGIRKEDKFRHIYIVGKTGMGKSTFMSNMIRSDMITNNGLAVVDPHGDLIDEVMAHIPSWRTNDVIIFDVGDTTFPIGFNILEYEKEEEKNLIASGVVSIFKRLYGNSWGPRLEYILRNVMLSVLEYPNATLMHVARMLTDKNFREDVLRSVKDPVILKFWRSEFDAWNDKQKTEAVWPITNKIGQFFSSTIMRNIFAQPHGKVKLRQIMDEGKILLINLSKGKIGDDNASMIGSFLVTKFQIDAMSRADIPFKERKDFYLYVDEFQNFATDSFESILSEARKYRLSLIVANQYTSQIQENVRNAIFGNVGTIVSFGLGYDDAVIMSSQYKDLINPNDLLSLPKFKAYTKLMVDGVTTDPFSMSTFPLPSPDLSEEIKEKIRKQSRQRYAMEKEKLENLLRIWAEKQFTQAERVAEMAQQEAEAAPGETFSIDNVKEGERYEWLVKLIYNYGIFVTVKWVEWLLHKSEINVQSTWVDADRKNVYTSWDRIRVYAKGFKEVNGEKKVIWSQKENKK